MVDKMNKWKPIETAPKDGTVILAWVNEPEGFYALIQWCSFRLGWFDASNEDIYWDYHPSHWMKLPLHPGAEDYE